MTRGAADGAKRACLAQRRRAARARLERVDADAARDLDERRAAALLRLRLRVHRAVVDLRGIAGAAS